MSEPRENPRPPAVDPPAVDPHPEATVGVVAETLDVSAVEEEVGALRVRIEVDEQAQPVVLESLRHEFVVERVARDEVVTTMRPPWRDGGTLVVPVYQERALLVKQWVLVEEVRLHERTQPQQRTETPVLRTERAVVERRQADGSWVATSE